MLKKVKKTPIKKKRPKSKLKVEKDNYLTEAEQGKKMLMWAGITFFMVLILVVWILNLKNAFKTSTVKKTGEEEMNWSKISSELTKTMTELKKGVNELKEASKDNGTAKPKEEVNLNQEEINKLKIKLENSKYNANTTNSPR